MEVNIRLFFASMVHEDLSLIVDAKFEHTLVLGREALKCVECEKLPQLKDVFFIITPLGFARIAAETNQDFRVSNLQTGETYKVPYMAIAEVLWRKYQEVLREAHE